MNKTIFIGLGVLAVAGIGYSAYIFWARNKNKNNIEYINKKIREDIDAYQKKVKASPEYQEYLKNGGKPF